MRIEPSKRALRVWERLADWYGARMFEQYGETPPRDWCRAVDAASDTQVRDGLTKMRQRHVSHPPTLPEFEQLLAPPRSSGRMGNPLQIRITEHVTRTLWHKLTPRQRVLPWSWLCRDSGGGIEITGVVIAADGDSPGYRINAEDITAE